MQTCIRLRGTSFRLATAVCTISAVAALTAQTVVTPPKNGAPLTDDVEIGLKAAAEVERTLPILDDDEVTGYVQGVGARLVGGIPANLQYKDFDYTFKVVDVKDVNAFALPGGPMFVHRGIIEIAHSEGELAGVMAHEMSHVALRHGTAQMSKSRTFGLGSLAGIVVGAVVGGAAGEAIYQGTQFGLNTALLKFSRGDEKQADLLGAQIMARANYDPRDLARMFETIEKQGSGRAPEWLSDHPNPGNRVEYINQEATFLIIDDPIRDSQAFDDVQEHLRTLPPAPTIAELKKRRK